MRYINLHLLTYLLTYTYLVERGLTAPSPRIRPRSRPCGRRTLTLQAEAFFTSVE